MIPPTRRRPLQRSGLAIALLVPCLAAAQQQPPQVQALQQTVIKLTGEALDWQTQAIALQRQVDDLTKQLAEAKKPKEAATKLADAL